MSLARRAALTAAAAASLVGAALAAPAASAANPSCTDLFDPSSGSYVGATPNSTGTPTYVCDVPAGTPYYDYVARGGYGANPDFAPYIGALGAKITGRLNVTAGETLTIIVGGPGLPGNDGQSYLGNSGGGGGGSTSITQQGSPFLIAGGGGGSGYDYWTPNPSGGAAGIGPTATSTGGTGASGDYSRGDQNIYGGTGGSNQTGGTGGSSSYGNGYGGPGGNGGNTGADGTQGGSKAGSGGGGYGAVGGQINGFCTGSDAQYGGVGGFPDGGPGCLSGGGGGGHAGGAGGGSVNGKGAGGGGGSSLVPADATAVNTGSDDDRLPRVELVPPAFAAPTITDVVPGEVSTAGGVSVTVTGTEFVDGSTTVSVGGQACTSVVVLSATSLTCVVPAHAAGQVDVVVTTPGGSTAPYSSFRYTEPTPTPTPTPTPSPSDVAAPMLARVAAGDGQLTATWIAPSTGPAPTSYRVVAGPGGKSCEVAAPELSCVISGLTNDTEYTLRVVAVAGGDESPLSNALTGIPRANGAQGAGASKKSKKPGTATLVVDGRRVPADRVTSDRLGETVFTDGDWRLGIKPENGQGNPQIVIDRALQPERGQFVRVSAGGFLPNSRARVFLFSKTWDMGEVNVRSDGTFSQRLRVPKAVPAGDHTIQVNGFSYDGKDRSASLGVVIRDAAATLTGVRKSTKATLQVFPQCRAQYSFRMQRRTDTGWATLGALRTRSELQRRTMDLDPGRYRAKVSAACDNPAMTTNTVQVGSRTPGKG